MAIYHLSAQVIRRSAGQSCVAAAAYRSGERLVNERDGVTHDYSRKTGVNHSVVLVPENGLKWMSDRGSLWNQVEECERRQKAQLAREFNIALPKELSLSEQKELIHGFAESQFVSKGFVADISIHDAEGNNPHAHVMIPLRSVDESGKYGFGTKAEGTVARYFNTKPALAEWREAWAEHANKALEVANSNERIDHRTLKEQGIDREAQVHKGKEATALERRGEGSRRGEQQKEVDRSNAFRKAFGELDRELRADPIKEIEFMQVQARYRQLEQTHPSLKRWRNDRKGSAERWAERTRDDRGFER